ncbi:MAG: AmmeMemoRadiSam system protein B [Candidatus Omnitrophota bacterium]|nr:MAG: AmmeMemoRadiSam system protein B [Candidatus Omnitrophota bacterium]
MLRKPVVNGQFYPAEKKDLEEIMEAFKRKEPSKISARAVILPHAGYIYSGKVAVTTVNKVLPKKKIIILGTNHTGEGADFSLWPDGEWQVPNGKIEVDKDLASSILAAGSLIEKDYSAHRDEHSIEVELPILKHFFGEFKIVPIACKPARIETYRQVASQIYEAVKKVKEDVFFVASSDMTHYEPDQAARRKDRLAIDRIVELDEEGLVEKVVQENISMCGIAPVAILLSCVKKLGAQKAQVALYQTSADSTGDYSAVVGYAGIIIK